MQQMPKCLLIAALMLLVLPAAAQTRFDPLAALKEALADETKAGPTLLALRATDDKDLIVLLKACAQSGDRKLRLFATTSLAQLAGADATEFLMERLYSDTSMVVRAEALVQLMGLKAMGIEQYRQAMKMDDESIRCIAARALIQKGQLDQARETLKQLAQSKDLATASMARLALLTETNDELARQIKQTFDDPKTSEDVLALLLEQIAEEKISAAGSLVKPMMTSAPTTFLCVRACRAYAAIAPEAPKELGQLLAKSDDLIFRVQLVRVIAENANLRPILEQAAKGSDPAAILARMELQRPGGSKLAALAQEAMASEHPIVIDYVLSAAAKDTKEHPDQAGQYVQALLKFVNSVPTNPDNMMRIHHRAAAAVKILADSGDPQARQGLAQIMAQPYDAVVRATVTGLGKSTNQATVCDLSRPLLKSPYRDLRVDAAMNLGRFGDKDAMATLEEAAAGAAQSPLLRAIACWYCIKISGQGKTAAAELAKLVK